MLRMAVGHSDDVDLDAALGTVFDQCARQLGDALARGGLLFASDEFDHAAVLAAINERYPGIELAGSTGVGEMSSVLGLQEDSLALALFASNDIDFTVGLGTDLGSDPAGAVRHAVDEARAKTHRTPALCIALLTAVVSVDPSAVLAHLRDELGPGVPILGGGAAPAVGMTRNPRPRAFINKTVTAEGIAVVLLSGPLAYSFGVDTGWRPVGARGIVTGATPGFVQEIDGRPAIELFERYLGPGDPSIGNPLAVFEEGSDRFYLRTAVGVDRSTGAIGVFGGVPVGATVQLTVAATDDIFEGTRAALSKALAEFPGAAPPAAGLVFSCAVRKYILGTRSGREIEMTRELFGREMPVAGFYCAGEIAPLEDADKTRFHNETIVAVLLGS